jgi:hypothetical protein
MHRAIRPRWNPVITGILAVGLLMVEFICPRPARAEIVTPALTNLASLMRFAAIGQTQAASVRLEGVVWWVNPTQRRLVLRDDSGAHVLEFQPSGDFPQVGQRVRIEGIGTVHRRGLALRLGAVDSVVDNDGVHARLEKSGAVYLESGPQPIRLEWFNALEGFDLRLEYEGPQLPRQLIPAAALQSGQLDTPRAGLEFRCYEVTGNLLPDFSTLQPVTSGMVSNFSLSILPQAERIGVVFTGRLQVPRSGLHTFYLQSDDGSRLLVGQPTFQITPLGMTRLPAPQRIAPGQIADANSGAHWVEVEGKVNLIRSTPHGLQLELAAGAGQMLLALGDSGGIVPETWHQARIRAIGAAQHVSTADGQTVTGVLLVPGPNEITILEPAAPPGTISPPPTSPGELPWLTTAADVHRLKREEAQRAYPVKISRRRHVCAAGASSLHGAGCDARAFMSWMLSPNRPDAAADSVSIWRSKGTTDPSLFAPIVNARRVHSSGAGTPARTA